MHVFCSFILLTCIFNACACTAHRVFATPFVFRMSLFVTYSTLKKYVVDLGELR